jgi:hypothetical protein
VAEFLHEHHTEFVYGPRVRTSDGGGDTASSHLASTAASTTAGLLGGRAEAPASHPSSTDPTVPEDVLRNTTA